MRPIFVSYRREDAEGEAGRLFDDLVAQFGEDSVFLDVEAIEVGRDYSQGDRRERCQLRRAAGDHRQGLDRCKK